VFARTLPVPFLTSTFTLPITPSSVSLLTATIFADAERSCVKVPAVAGVEGMLVLDGVLGGVLTPEPVAPPVESSRMICS